uniref:peptidylprolyl isomerase n=1 Tax=Lactuca sativa TaxID=4236 RepID=A0A9R1UCG1_LACSA|nr:hypothetical protein LSAT_V11C900474440 [Lactuca sativa]
MRNTAATGDGGSNGTFFRVVLLVRREKYDEALEYVERARKCLATELAAMVIDYYTLLVGNSISLNSRRYLLIILLFGDGKTPHYMKVDRDKWADEDDDAGPAADLDMGEIRCVGGMSKPDIGDFSMGDDLEEISHGKLTDGTVFDSSFERGDPIEFELGTGWDQGLLGMCVGEKRKLKIPSKLGYGDLDSPPTIPGGATLIFDKQ